MDFDNSENHTAQVMRAMIAMQGLTISEVARRIGTTKQNLFHKFKENHFTEKDIRAIADCLGYDVIIQFKKRREQ